MINKLYRKGALVLVLAIIFIELFSLTVAAQAPTSSYYVNPVFTKAKDNEGYSGSKDIKEKDRHYGWKLGSFVVEGYTNSPQKDSDGNQIFLKNTGDTVTLSFRLEQDIEKLNGDDRLSIARDKKGYDKYFQLDKQNFGRGALIVRQTDAQNLAAAPVVYADYLSGLTVGADTQIQLCEEGDYEVALNYKVKKTNASNGSKRFGSSSDDYRIFIKFSVRNGNSMIYPFDVKTGNELANGAITENGFRLDLAKSRFLEMHIKKEILADGATGIVEDTRFNKSAKDGEIYTDEGIYTITVRNVYTDIRTVKKIFVGKDSSLKEFFSAETDGNEEPQIPNQNINTTGGVTHNSATDERNDFQVIPTTESETQAKSGGSKIVLDFNVGKTILFASFFAIVVFVLYLSVKRSGDTK